MPCVIRTAIREQPEMAQAVIRNLSDNLRMLVNMVEELSFHQVTNRLARLIAHLPPDQLGGQTNPHITQDQLAARLGTVREVVARSLRELERSGAIRVQRRHIEVIDESVLRDWSEEPPIVKPKLPALRAGNLIRFIDRLARLIRALPGRIVWITAGVPAASTAFSCAWRARSVASPRMRSASSGLWKPMLFSAAMKSQRSWASRCRLRASVSSSWLTFGYCGSLLDRSQWLRRWRLRTHPWQSAPGPGW